MGYYADQHQNNPRVARQLQNSNVQSSASVGPVGSSAQLPLQPIKSSSGVGGKNFYLMTRDDEPFCGEERTLFFHDKFMINNKSVLFCVASSESIQIDAGVKPSPRRAHFHVCSITLNY